MKDLLNKVTGIYEEKKPSALSFLKNLKNKFKLKKKPKPSKFSVFEVCVLVIATAIVSLNMGGFIATVILSEHNSDNELSTEMKDFIKNYDYIKDNYYGKFNEKKVLDSAIKGVLYGLGDPYSNFLDAANDINFEISLKGSFQGIGIEIVNNGDNRVRILNVMADSPAEKAGLKIGDLFTSVNGVSMIGKSSSELSAFIRTAKENDFVIKIIRVGVEKTFNITKEVIIIKSVSSKTFNIGTKKIGYIKVDIFSATTYNQFKVALLKLESEKIDSLIIDVRDNAGGHLSVVKDMTSLFLNSKHIIYQTEDKNGKEKEYSTGKVDKKYPIVFLANGASASASELMIGALKDELGSIMIGEQTFGKGTVQELQDLSSGNSYKFTTKKWLTPKGAWIHGKGITPTIVIKLNDKYKANPSDANDNQLQKALEYLNK